MSYTPVEKRNSAGAGIPAKPVSVGGYVPVSSRSSSSVADYIPVEQRPDGFVPLQTVKTPEPVVETPKKPGIISKIASLPGKAIKGAGNLLAKTYGPNIEAGLAMQDETGADKVLKKVASLVGGASPENLPLGVGEVVKGYKDVFNNPNDYSEFTLEDVLKGIVDTAKEVEKIPFKAVSNLALKPVKFNLPVLGEVTNRQYDATRRINNGENPVAVAAEEGINSIFDTLFLAGLANEVAGPRHVVSGNMKNVDMKTIDAKTGNPTTTSVPSELLNTPGPKNFKLYQNPTTQNTRLISPETVKLMIEQEKITPNANFNPKLPTYFKGSFKPNGNFVGEVIQVKPSWVSVIAQKFGGDISKAPPQALTQIFAPKEVSSTDLATGLKAPIVVPKNPNIVPTSVEGYVPVEARQPAPVQTMPEPVAPQTTQERTDVLLGKAPIESIKTAPNPEVIKGLETELQTAYKNIPEAEKQMHEILVSLELAEPGQRIFLEHDGTRDSNVIAVSSTFPAWIPDGLRTKKSLDALRSLIKDISSITYPTRSNAVGRRLLVDTMLDVLDGRLGVNTKAIRQDILKQYGTIETSNTKVSGGSEQPAGRGELTAKRAEIEAKQAEEKQDQIDRLKREIESGVDFDGPISEKQIAERKAELAKLEEVDNRLTTEKLNKKESKDKEVIYRKGDKVIDDNGDTLTITAGNEPGVDYPEKLKDNNIGFVRVKGKGDEQDYLYYTNRLEKVEKSQKEKVAESVKETPKSIKEISEETKIKEPNIRRILGVGAKEGTFERVDKGVYVLSKGGEDLVWVEANDALESVSRLAKEGFKADMIFLDPPYNLAGNRGGNRMNEKEGTLFETITPEEFGGMMEDFGKILRDENKPIIYMVSQSLSSQKGAERYTKQILDAGFIPVAKGDYFKMTKDGKRFTKPLRPEPLDPEAIYIFNKSGELDTSQFGDMQFKLVRPKGYKTEKPAELLKQLITMTTNEGDMILDPFAGSGVTGAEAVKAGRKAYLVEKNPEVVEKITKPRVERAVEEIKPETLTTITGKKVDTEKLEKVREDIENSRNFDFEYKEGDTLYSDGKKYIVKSSYLEDGKAVYNVYTPGKKNLGAYNFTMRAKNIDAPKKQEKFEVGDQVKIVNNKTGKVTYGIVDGFADAKKGVKTSASPDAPVDIGAGIKVAPTENVMFGPNTFRYDSNTITKEKLTEKQLKEIDDAGLQKYNSLIVEPEKPYVPYSQKYKKGEEIVSGKRADAEKKLEKIEKEINRKDSKYEYFPMGKVGFDRNTKKQASSIDKSIELAKKHVEATKELETLDSAEKNYDRLVREYYASIQLSSTGTKSNGEKFTREELKELSAVIKRYETKLGRLERQFNFTRPELETQLPKGPSGDASIGNFSDGTPIELGSLDKIRPIEFPELVDIARDLTGNVPFIKKLREKRGLFKDGDIFLNPDIFNTPEQFAKTLAHEIGHLVDYLPEGTLARGNLLGRLKTLQGFMSETFGKEGGVEGPFSKERKNEIKNKITKEVLAENGLKFGDLFGNKLTKEERAVVNKEINTKTRDAVNKVLDKEGFLRNKVIQKELMDVTLYWRPNQKTDVMVDEEGSIIFDEETGKPKMQTITIPLERYPESYQRYRKSSRELYADAISMLFNTPGTLERMAPTFYKEFFNALDQKPAVMNAYFELQELLGGDRDTLLARRRAGVRGMFEKGDMKASDIQKAKMAIKEQKQKDFVFKFKFDFIDKNFGVIDRINKMKKEGKNISDEENPLYYLEERNYLGGKIKSFMEKNIQPVYAKLGDAGISWTDFGEALFYERIASGDRSDVANPRGITPKAAQELRDKMNETLSPEQVKVLEKGILSFREAVKSIAEEAFQEGLYKPEMHDQLMANPAYATFQVLDHMEEGMTSKIHKSMGTLKDVSNPADATLLKTISTLRAIERNKTTRAVVEFLDGNFPKDIKEADYLHTPKGKVPKESKDPELELVTYMKDGRRLGYYVDRYIKESVDNGSISRNNAILDALRIMNSKLFRPLFITYNPGFQAFNFIRDFKRFWKNTPTMTIGRALSLYRKAIPAAKARAWGDITNETIQKMEAEQILSISYNQLTDGADIEAKQIDTILQNSGIDSFQPEVKNKFLKPFYKVLDFVKDMGDFVETLPKVAGYLEFTKGETVELSREQKSFIRKNIGSPDFLAGGYWKPISNEIFLFSNSITQGIRSDFNIATGPTTRSGYWWKTAADNFLPKILMFLASLGFFGAGVKEIMDGASEYDKTNYTIVPLGKDENGKPVYFRVPQDEGGRLLGGILWKAINSTGNKQNFGKDLLDMASFTGGQIPSVTPSITATVATGQFIAGQNPYDWFRNREVLTDDQMKAGGMYSAKPFMGWLFNQSGGGIFYRFTQSAPRDQSATEKLFNFPLVGNIAGRFIRVSDYGKTEEFNQIKEEVQSEQSKRRLDESAVINDYIKEAQKGLSDASIETLVAENKADLVNDVLGHAPTTKEELTRANNIVKKYQIGLKRGESDPIVNSLISAVTNEEKVTLLTEIRKSVTKQEYNKLMLEMLKYKIVSAEVFIKVPNPEKKQ